VGEEIALPLVSLNGAPDRGEVFLDGPGDFDPRGQRRATLAILIGV
jgi:hypothetical protein